MTFSCVNPEATHMPWPMLAPALLTHRLGLWRLSRCRNRRRLGWLPSGHDLNGQRGHDDEPHLPFRATIACRTWSTSACRDFINSSFTYTTDPSSSLRTSNNFTAGQNANSWGRLPVTLTRIGRVPPTGVGPPACTESHFLQPETSAMLQSKMLPTLPFRAGEEG